MKKKILAVAMSIMATMMIITGCGSKKELRKPDTVAKLDTNVTAEDLLKSENMQTFSEIKELKDFKGTCKLDINVDVDVVSEEETAPIKANLSCTFAHDGKVLHTITETDADVMDQKTNEKTEMWYDDESKVQYMQQGENWVKYSGEDFESVISEFTGFDSMSSEFDIDEMLKELKLELDETNGVYILKYEASIKDLINKVPEGTLDEAVPEMDVTALVESLNIPEDFKVKFNIIFNADKTLKGMEVSLSETEIDLSALAGATAKIKVNKADIKVAYSEVETLTVPEDVIKNASDPWEDGNLDIEFDYNTSDEMN